MDKTGSDIVHYKYSKEDLLTISRLELSLKKPEVLEDEFFNDNKRWSPELGFKAMVLESRHANGNLVTKPDIRNDVITDPNVPKLRPNYGGWELGCVGMKNVVPQQNPVPSEDTLRPPKPKAKIIIPPRPQEERLLDSRSQHSRPWRQGHLDPLDPGRDRPWNGKPPVSIARDHPERPNNRYEQDFRYQNHRSNGHRYHDRYEEDINPDDLWDSPSENAFEFEALPGDTRGEEDMNETSSVTPPMERPSSGTGQSSIPVRSESPDMESRMMSELLKIFDDSEQDQPSVSVCSDQMINGSNYQSRSANTDQHRQTLARGRQAESENQYSYTDRQHAGGAVGNDLLRMLQEAQNNVNNFVASPSGVPSMNVAQAKSLAEIESGIAHRGGGLGRSSPQEPHHKPGENHAFNKLLEMMNSSRSRTENNQQNVAQHFQPQRVSSYDLERIHEEKKRLEYQQHQMAQEARRDSVGSTGSLHSFVPIQVMRQARSHFQDQIPRPVVGRTGSSGSNSGFVGQSNPFGPRMGLSDVEIRQLSQFRSPAGGPRPGMERNSPVNLPQQQPFMIPPQLRGAYGQQQLQSGMALRPSQMPVGAPGQPRGMLGTNQQHFQSRAPSQQMLPSQSQGPMNLQQLQMLNQHLHSLPPQQLSEMSRGMTNEQLNQMLLRASHQ